MMEQSMKIQRKSAADLVCDKMKELIGKGSWPQGEKIPTEKELAQTFGVNRLTVRIAMQRLSSLGLLDIRVGDGTYVKAFDLKTQISELAEFYIKEETLQNVGEYRIMLELGCVKAILERRTEQELETFRGLCLQFQEEVRQFLREQDPARSEEAFGKSVDTAIELHATLIDMTHNDLMRYAFALAREPMLRHAWHNASKRGRDLDENQDNIWGQQWMGLYEALKNREEEEVRRILQRIILF